MKTAEEILNKNAPVFQQDFDHTFKESVLKAMEEYKNQFIDFDGPIAMIDHYHRLATDRAYELGNANEIIKLREKELQAAKDEIFRLLEIIHDYDGLDEDYAKCERENKFHIDIINSQAKKHFSELKAFDEDLNKAIGRANALEEWLTEYRDYLKDTDYRFNRNSTINAINELLNPDENL